MAICRQVAYKATQPINGMGSKVRMGTVPRVGHRAWSEDLPWPTWQRKGGQTEPSARDIWRSPSQPLTACGRSFWNIA